MAFYAAAPLLRARDGPHASLPRQPDGALGLLRRRHWCGHDDQLRTDHRLRKLGVHERHQSRRSLLLLLLLLRKTLLIARASGEERQPASGSAGDTCLIEGECAVLASREQPALR